MDKPLISIIRFDLIFSFNFFKHIIPMSTNVSQTTIAEIKSNLISSIIYFEPSESGSFDTLFYSMKLKKFSGSNFAKTHLEVVENILKLTDEQVSTLYLSGTVSTPYFKLRLRSLDKLELRNVMNKREGDVGKMSEKSQQLTK
jgi:hypothetical protein